MEIHRQCKLWVLKSVWFSKWFSIMLHHFPASAWLLTTSRILKSLKEYSFWQGGEEKFKTKGASLLLKTYPSFLPIRCLQAWFSDG